MVEKVLDVTREQMLADIAEQLKPFEPPDEWFTAREMGVLWDMPYHQAIDRLEKLYRDDKVIKHVPGGKYVYWEMVKDD